MEKTNINLGKGRVGKLLFSLALPCVVAQIINMLYNLVDRVYIGHIPGDGSLALTGVGVVLPIIMVVSAFASLAASGGAPLASISMGKKDNKKAEEILSNSFFLLVVLGILITVILLIFAHPLLLSFGASNLTIDYAESYLKTYSLGTTFVLLTLGLNAFIVAEGKTIISMLIIIIGAVLNIILDPIFIFALDMGVKGAALATIISQAVSGLWCVLYLIRKAEIKLTLKCFKPDFSILKKSVSLGLSTFVMQASESVIMVLFNASLLKYGGDLAVGAMTICVSSLQFVMLPLQGIGQGAQPLISYNYGARNKDRVKKAFKTLLITDLIYSFTLWSMLMLFPRFFASIFTRDEALITFTEKALRIYCGALCLMGAQCACQMTFVSIGNALNSIVVAVVRKFVLLLPFIFIMPHIFSDKTLGVIMAEPFADILAVTFTVILFSIQFKKSMLKINNEE